MLSKMRGIYRKKLANMYLSTRVTLGVQQRRPRGFQLEITSPNNRLCFMKIRTHNPVDNPVASVYHNTLIFN